MTPESYVNIANDFSKIFASKAADVLTTISSSHLDIKSQECQKSPAFDWSVLKNHVFITIKFKGFIDGPVFIAMPKNSVARFSDLMMMGDGTAEYEDDFNEAISELINQVTGAFITELTGQYSEKVENVGVMATAAEVEKTEINKEKSFLSKAEIEMEGFDKTEYYFIFNEDTVGTILKNLDGSVERGLSASEPEKPAKQGKSGSSDYDMKKADFPDFNRGTSPTSSGDADGIDYLLDIGLDVSIELGRSKLSIRDVLDLTAGSIVELDRLAGEPVDILVNGKVIAKGEVIVIDEKFGVRLNNLVTPEERLRNLR